MKTGGWGGRYKDFSLDSTHQVFLETLETGQRPQSILFPRDVASRTRYNTCTTFTIVVNQRLDQKRFLAAASAVLKMYPALGSRLQLHPLPASLDLSRLAFPVSFATWPEGSSARFQDDYHWQGTSDDGHFIPDAPFFHGLEVEKIVNGHSHLFTLQVTSLGDGASLIAATWLHALADGMRMGKVLNALAAVYRSQNNGFPQATSYQPSQVIEHQLSRTCPLSDAGQPYGGDASHTVADVTQKGLREKYSQDGLLEGPARVNDPANYRALYGSWVAQSNDIRPGWNGVVTVRLAKAGLKRLKASLQTHPLLTGVHFSTNDVILALSWMLQCDAKGYTRPGEGPAGNTRCAAVTMDLSTLVPTQAPPWYLGNYVTAVPVSVVSTGDSNDGAHLGITMSPALARTIRAIRAAIIDARSPAKLRHALTLPFEDRMSSTGFLASLARAKATGIDAVFTNWNHSSHETMDFGRGPPASLNGHFGIQQCNLVGIVGLADSAYGIRLPFSSKEAKQRLQGSRVLSDIREFSDLLGA